LAFRRKYQEIRWILSGAADLRDIGPQVERAIQLARCENAPRLDMIFKPHGNLIRNAGARILRTRLELPGVGDEAVRKRRGR